VRDHLNLCGITDVVGTGTGKTVDRILENTDPTGGRRDCLLGTIILADKTGHNKGRRLVERLNYEGATDSIHNLVRISGNRM